MATEAQGRVQQAVERMLNDVERQRLRPLLVSCSSFNLIKHLASYAIAILSLIFVFLPEVFY